MTKKENGWIIELLNIQHSVDYRDFDNSNIIIIHKYLIKNTWWKTMFGFIKKVFIGLLTDLIKASNHKKCVFLSNQKCKVQPTLIKLHPNE